MGTLYGIDGALLECQYRNHLSGYLHWDQLAHAQDWLLFEKNIGAYVCIDEVALSRGELYTILTNRAAHGGKGSIIAIIKGTDVCTVSSVLLRLSRCRRHQVREITLDMAPNMEQIARSCFPAAKRVTDRFHVQKLAYEAVQQMRVKARWEALDENPHRLPMQKPVVGYITLPSSLMETRRSSCWQEASIFFTRKNPCGPSPKENGLISCLKSIRRLRKAIIWPCV